MIEPLPIEHASTPISRWRTEKYRAWRRKRQKHLKRYKAGWFKAHRQRCAAAMRRHVERLKAAVRDLYGSRCACCGEARTSMLDLDHVHGGGNVERRDKTDSLYLYRRLSKLTATDPRYQLLCCNCNQSKRRNGGLCEHATEDDLHGRMAGACSA